MTSIETFIALLLAAILIALIAKHLDQPYPIALVLAGLGLASIPGAPRVHLDPDIVFFLLLPPILSEAAFFTSWRDFWRLRRAIFLLAFGLVAATSSLIAFLCVHFIPGMTWATGFVLGAIISPPDAAAATSITRGLGLPKRVIQILEGESLVNDASGLTLYRFAILAVIGGGFSWFSATLSFAWIVLGGAAVGGLLGYAFIKLYAFLRDPQVEILSTFLVSYLSYFAAEQMHASGVIATVTSGLILGWHAPELFNASSRIRALAVWQTVTFLINSAIFLLIGLQIPTVLEGLGGYPKGQLLWWSAIMLAGVIAVRFLWVFPAAYLPRALSNTIRQSEPHPNWRGVFIVGWTGLRGVVSLAAALALPLETQRGLPFPYRNLLIFLTFAVILGTLFIQGLPLRWIVGRLQLPTDRSSEREELQARIHATEKVMESLIEMQDRGESTGNAFDRVVGYYEDRLAGLRARLESETGIEKVDSPEDFQSINEQRLWWKLVRIERSAVLSLRNQHKIGDETLHEIERDIDLLEARITPKS